MLTGEVFYTKKTSKNIIETVLLYTKMCYNKITTTKKANKERGDAHAE